MAVQAQYPSNVVFLNNGSNDNRIDDANDINTRKRGREVTAGAAVTAAISTTPMDSFSLQMQPSRLIELSQLRRPNFVSTGLRLSFGDRQNQNQHFQQQQRRKNLVSDSNVFLSILSDDLDVQMKRQREELEQFLQVQGNELRRTFAEKRNRDYHALLVAAEESVARRITEKEAEVERATRRKAELEARAAQLSAEAQVWQAKAREQEATAASLQVQLRQAMITGGVAATTTARDSRRGDERLKSAVGVEGQAEDAESVYVDPKRMAVSGPCCKACRIRAASVVLLPCRHLCLCTECDRVAQTCPLCLSVRNSSVEVFLF